MADKEITLEQEVKKFIETLDKLAYEKPAGYQAFLAVCGSSSKLADFRALNENITKSNDGDIEKSNSK